MARASIPEGLEIKKSQIPLAGLGVFSTTTIPAGVRFGPYQGKRVQNEEVNEETDTSYMWEVSCYCVNLQFFLCGQELIH